MVLSQGPGDVLGTLSCVDAHFVAADRHGVAAQLEHGQLGRTARPGRRFLKNKRHASAAEHAWRVIVTGELEHRHELARRQVLYIEKVTAHAASPSTRSRMPTPSSISSSLMVRGGSSRNADAVTAFTIKPCCKQRAATTSAFS